MRRVVRSVLAATALCAGLAAFEARAGGYAYHPPSFYAVPPVVTYYAPPVVYHAPVVVHQPVVVDPPFYLPGPVSYAPAVGYRVRDRGRWVKSEYRYHTPYGRHEVEYKFDRRYGTVDVDYDFDD